MMRLHFTLHITKIELIFVVHLSKNCFKLVHGVTGNTSGFGPEESGTEL